ncbi:uL15 family ribosomal protein [Candidatus Woesearchaeota archaeon]|nr:uL15 family ribosomal protein [Candidatus Woesearchaeota archaeon]
MTVNKRKKSARYRGSKTHGKGSKKKRRGSGNRGGKGRGGSGKRADSKKPSLWRKRYFGKHGFTSRDKGSVKAVSIKYLDENTMELISQKLMDKDGEIFSVDLKKLGFNKLLSDGKAVNKYRVEVPYASKKAIEKIKSKGGDVILK